MNENIVTAGFSGRREEGSVCLLHRDGTTTTALVLADYVKATLVDNWSNVPGLYAADPAIVPTARIVPEVSASELMPLCFRKALKVLDRNSVHLARSLGITLRICSPQSPEGSGTYVRPEQYESAHGLTGIGIREPVTVLTLTGEDLPYIPGIGLKFIQLCAKGEHDVDFIGVGDSISVIVFRVMTPDQIAHIRFECKERFKAVLEVEVLSQVLLVGAYMRNRVGVMARIACALSKARINIVTDGQTSAQTHVGITVFPEDAHRAVNVLYEEFFEETATQEVLILQH